MRMATIRPVAQLGQQATCRFFEIGIIELAAGDVRIHNDGKYYLFPRTLENEFAAKVYDYMSVLSEAGVAPPVFIMLGGVRMHGTNCCR